MSTIWKASLELAERQKVELPRGAKIISAQYQHGFPAIWFECDPKATQVIRQVTIVGTGHEIPKDAGDYLATLVDGSPFVWHLYLSPEQQTEWPD